MTQTITKIETEKWVDCTWEEYLNICENPDYEKAKIYYFNNRIRIEMPLLENLDVNKNIENIMSPLGNNHASDHNIIAYAITLYASLKSINLNGKDNCTYQKTGYQSAQPDLSYYIGENVNSVPYFRGVINLDIYPAPNLVIEIASTSLTDDLGNKRLLYENFGTQEYWIVDVEKQKIIAFSIIENGSQQIRQSQVLNNLDLTILEQALSKTRQENQSQVGAWLLQQFQQSEGQS